MRCREAATANVTLGNPGDNSGERLPSATPPVPPWVIQEKVAMVLPTVSMLTSCTENVLRIMAYIHRHQYHHHCHRLCPHHCQKQHPELTPHYQVLKESFTTRRTTHSPYTISFES